jgi:hypothetical protein
METDSGLTLEPMAPTHEAPDPEVSFADVGLTSPALATGSPESRRTEESAAPSMIPSPPSKKAWDFEPVDPPRASSPPEESLNFAEEALNRSSQREGSRALFRVVLWSCGALAGVALLTVSVWMAMAHRESADEAQSLAPPPPSQVADSVAVGSGAPKDSTSVRAGVPTTAAPEPSTAPPPTPAPPPQPKPQAQPGTGTSVASTSGPGTKATTPKSSATMGAGSKAIPNAAVSTSGSQPASGSHGAESSAPQTAPSPAPPRRGPPTREEGFEPVTDGPADTKATWSQSDFTPPPTQTQRKPAVSTRPPVLFEPAPVEARPATPPDETDTSGPVGRLHLATVKAHEERDLEALRKIKASWKSYLRTALGVDRERAKREMADCLWAIQEMTGRDADRKEALTAYREYVLHAPAGGADSRTINRMRHLEDVLSDSQ